MRAATKAKRGKAQHAGSGGSLRTRKKLENRDTLARMAAKLFRARGFEAVTLDEIAAAAGVSRRTYFRYYATKEAVVFPHAADRLDRFRAMLARFRVERVPYAAVRKACLEMAREFGEHREHLLEQHEIVQGSVALIAHEQALDLEWEAAMAEALLRGSSRAARLRANVLAGALMGAVRATLREWFLGEAKADPIYLAEGTLDLLSSAAQQPAPKRRR
jgi:AcrR family transcriptional regulator